ncbi:MAG: hypothetical protein ACTSWR_06650 [Candidatus Helarchaeota archaeon]
MLENQEIPAELGEDSWSGVPADFYGMDRDEESVSEHVEGLIAKNRTTADEAMAILQLLLENATGHQTYEYTVCNKVGAIERLELASDILKIVPFDAQAMQNGPTGDKPNSPILWFFLIITGLILVVSAVLATIYLFVKLWEFLARWGLKLLASFAESAKQALENAVKIIILVLLLMSLAFELLFIVILFGLFFILSICTFNKNQYSVLLVDLTKFIIIDNVNNHTFSLEYKIVWKYDEILDMELPESNINIYIDGIEFSKIKRFEIRNMTGSNIETTSNYQKLMEGMIAAKIIILTFLSLYILMFYAASQYIMVIPFLLIGILTIFEIVITNSITKSMLMNDDQSSEYILNLIVFLIGFSLVFLLDGFSFLGVLIGKVTFDLFSFIESSLEILISFFQSSFSFDYLNLTFIILHVISLILIFLIDHVLLKSKTGKNAMGYCAIILCNLIFMFFGLRLFIYSVEFLAELWFTLFLIQ